VSGETALEIGAPMPLFEAPMLGGPIPGPAYRQQFDVSPDGQKFLLNVPTEDAGPLSDHRPPQLNGHADEVEPAYLCRNPA
jgi:hypothetical protein